MLHYSHGHIAGGRTIAVGVHGKFAGAALDLGITIDGQLAGTKLNTSAALRAAVDHGVGNGSLSIAGQVHTVAKLGLQRGAVQHDPGHIALSGRDRALHIERVAAGTGGILYAVEGAVHGGLNAKGICTTVIGVQLINKQACPALQSNVLAHGHGSVASGVGIVGTVNYYRRIIGLLLVQLAAAGNIQSTMIDADIVVLNKTGIKAVHIQGDLPAVLNLDLCISGRALQQRHGIAVPGRSQGSAQAGVAHTVDLGHSGFGVDDDLAVGILHHAGLDIGADVPSRTVSRLEGAAGDVDACFFIIVLLIQCADKITILNIQVHRISVSRRTRYLNFSSNRAGCVNSNRYARITRIAAYVKCDFSATGGNTGAALNIHITAVVRQNICSTGSSQVHIFQGQVGIILDKNIVTQRRIDIAVFNHNNTILQQLESVGLCPGGTDSRCLYCIGMTIQVQCKTDRVITRSRPIRNALIPRTDTAAGSIPQQGDNRVTHSVSAGFFVYRRNCLRQSVIVGVPNGGHMGAVLTTGTGRSICRQRGHRQQ